MRNRKGFADIVIISIVAIVGLVTWLVGPQLVKSTGDVFSGGSKNTKSAVHTKSTQEPIVLGVDAKGKDIIGYKTTTENSTQDIAEMPKQSLMDKIKGLGAWAILLVIGIVATGSGPFVWNWIKKLKASALAWEQKHQALNTASIDIVQAIDDGWDAYDAAVDVYRGLYNAATDPVAKAGYLTTVSALQTAKQAMKDKIYAELDNTSLAKLTQLQTVQAH